MPTPEEKAAADAAAAAAAAATGNGKDTGASDSALGKGAEKLEIPEKYQVKDKDGKVDEQASMRAVVKAYTELNKRMIDVGLPPEKPEDYEIEAPKGVDLEELRKDPDTASFLKSAHAMGMTNKQISFVINRYLELAPELAGAAQDLSADECIAQLGLTWKSDAELTANLQASNKASVRLAEKAGLKYDDIETAGLGNHPIFIRLMHALAKEMGEDTSPPGEGGGNAGDFDTQVVALRKELDAIPERSHKERDAVKAKLDALYTKRYGGKRAGFTAAA
jgi:hypothetical protein